MESHRLICTRDTFENLVLRIISMRDVSYAQIGLAALHAFQTNVARALANIAPAAISQTLRDRVIATSDAFYALCRREVVPPSAVVHRVVNDAMTSVPCAAPMGAHRWDDQVTREGSFMLRDEVILARNAFCGAVCDLVTAWLHLPMAQLTPEEALRAMPGLVLPSQEYPFGVNVHMHVLGVLLSHATTAVQSFPAGKMPTAIASSVGYLSSSLNAALLNDNTVYSYHEHYTPLVKSAQTLARDTATMIAEYLNEPVTLFAHPPQSPGEIAGVSDLLASTGALEAAATAFTAYADALMARFGAANDTTGADKAVMLITPVAQIRQIVDRMRALHDTLTFSFAVNEGEPSTVALGSEDSNHLAAALAPAPAVQDPMEVDIIPSSVPEIVETPAVEPPAVEDVAPIAAVAVAAPEQEAPETPATPPAAATPKKAPSAPSKKRERPAETESTATPPAKRAATAVGKRNLQPTPKPVAAAPAATPKAPAAAPTATTPSSENLRPHLSRKMDELVEQNPVAPDQALSGIVASMTRLAMSKLESDSTRVSMLVQVLQKATKENPSDLPNVITALVTTIPHDMAFGVARTILDMLEPVIHHNNVTQQ